jgi:hypothetical protein
MPDLVGVYNGFNADEPLSAREDPRYVELYSVWGSKVAPLLKNKIVNAGNTPSHHLLMGHTKCGKTTELNRLARSLEDDGYVTVVFDVAEVATRTFEYTTVLLTMAGQVLEQLSKRQPPIHLGGPKVEELTKYLKEREITIGSEISGDATGKAEAKPGLLIRLLGEFGIGVELRGGFKRSREITSKIEADYHGFLAAFKSLIEDAVDKVLTNGQAGLVVICDGCDKLAVSATDENGNTYDLQSAMFVDHAADLRSVPCHVVYTVPISIPVNLGDIWEESPEFVPAVPVSTLPGVDESYANDGRAALREVVERRLKQKGTSVQELFTTPALLEELINASGGHISDLLLLVRVAVLETQADKATNINEEYVNRSIQRRALEYSRLIESEYLSTLARIDHLKTRPSNSDHFRDIIFKRLVLEYLCGDTNRVDLHPLVAASDAYRKWQDI